MNAFAALSDKTRRDIVRMVAKRGELTSSEISQSFKMSPPAISQHLKILREAKVLAMKKDAQKRVYSLSDSGLDEVEDWLLEIKDLWEKRPLENHFRKRGRRNKSDYGADLSKQTRT
jgi:DNA-binding transcriptional ArsR family regulator